MLNMTEGERDLLRALAGAIGDFARLQRVIRLGASPAVVDEMATAASARARAVLVTWPMSEAPAEALAPVYEIDDTLAAPVVYGQSRHLEALERLVAAARNAGAV